MHEDLLKILKVDDAAFLVAELFKQSFGSSPPTTPTHYVAFYQVAPSTFEVVGYYHVTSYGEYALVGGLCVDPRYRQHGLGERLSRIAFEDAKEIGAFFAYLANPISVGIARRIGYVSTNQQHLMVRWMRRLPEEEQERIVAEVAALGPF